MRKNGMYTAYTVHHLGDSKVNHEASHSQRLILLKAMQFFHQLQHTLQGDKPGFIKILMQAECYPTYGCVGAGHREVQIAVKVELDLDQLHRTFQSYSRHLAVPLRGVAVADGKQPTFYGNGQVQSAARDQFFAIEIAATKPGRVRGVSAWLIWRHPHGAHERLDGYFQTKLVRGDASVRIQCPSERTHRPIGQAKSVVHRAGKTTAIRLAPCARSNRLDLNLKSHPWLGALNGDRATEGKASTLLGGLMLEPLRLFKGMGLLDQSPPGVQRSVSDCITRVDGKDRRELA